MFSELIDIFTLLATLPNRGVALAATAFIIVTFLFALEFAAPLIVLVGFILKVSALIVLKASALPRAGLSAGRALPEPPGPSGQNQIKESGAGVDSDAKCNPVDSIGSSTKSRVSHSEHRPSARFPGDKDGSARRNIEPRQ